MTPYKITYLHIINVSNYYLFSGTYFLLYDFLDYFEKDGPSFLQREKFLEIVDTIFKDFSKIKREAIVFQVSLLIFEKIQHYYLLNHNISQLPDATKYIFFFINKLFFLLSFNFYCSRKISVNL